MKLILISQKSIKLIQIIVLVSLIIMMNACLVIRHEEEAEKPFVLNLSPLPELEMSDIMIKSELGDIFAFIPENWFIVNLEGQSPSDVISVAVNPEYTISIVFSKIRKLDKYEEIVAREELLGLARLSMEQRVKKTAGAVKLTETYSTINMGPRRFAKYIFANSDNSMMGISAVFKSSINDYYEMTVLPINLTGIEPVSRRELEKVFNSVLTTVQY